MKQDWASYVPEVTLRPVQVDALDRIHAAFYEEDKPIVFLEAPTGVGKSIIQLALCRWAAANGHGNSFMVTPQKALQDQMREWDGLKLMKGRGSYECLVVHGHSAREAPCMRNPGMRENYDKCSDTKCPYFSALREAKESPIVLHNYASLLAQARISNHFEARHLLCLDEGHTAAGWVRNYMTLELKEDELHTLTSSKIPDDVDKFMPWFRLIVGKLLGSSIPSGVDDKIIATLLKVAAHQPAYGVVGEEELMEAYLEEVGGTPSDERGDLPAFDEWAMRYLKGEDLNGLPWHVGVSTSEKTGLRMWTCTPVRVGRAAWLLTRLGEKVLVVTATVLNKALLAAELGMSAKDVELISIDRAFDKDKRPVFKRYAGNMTYRDQASTFPKAVDAILEIAEEFVGQQGIIHTVSHSLAEMVASNIRPALDASMYPREVVQVPQGSLRDHIIAKFLDGGFGEGAILVGPSLMEGIDAKYQAARWQVLLKVPWPHVKDPVVSALLDDRDPERRKWGQAWYTWKTAQQTVQGIGRVCRADDDYGVTFLLDAGFDRVLRSGYVPEHVLASIR